MSSISEPIRVENGSASDAIGAFDEFYRDRYQRAVRLAVILTGSAAAAEDAVQDVMAEVCKKWARIDRYDNPDAWLRRALVNRAISRHRRAVVAAKGLLRLRSEARLSIELVDRDWELWSHVRSLPARQAQMVALVYAEGLTMEAAAEVLGISAATAKSHLARAKHRLERELSDWRST
jgi:RNA polymerase sigma-70 factor, ECF subfamily